MKFGNLNFLLLVIGKNYLAQANFLTRKMIKDYVIDKHVKMNIKAGIFYRQKM